jgi:hypothetical protein
LRLNLSVRAESAGWAAVAPAVVVGAVVTGYIVGVNQAVTQIERTWVSPSILNFITDLIIPDTLKQNN